MKNLKTLNMGARKFEIVDELPQGYQIWNIGREHFNFEGFIPLCRVVGNFSINPDTLKALKVKSEAMALRLMDISIKKNTPYKKLKVLLEQGDEADEIDHEDLEAAADFFDRVSA